MKTKVLITIDTEPDNMWVPQSRDNPQYKNISELGALQKVFDRFSAKPTYLTTYSVAKSENATVLKDIAKSGRCEIGSHLHALETPPFEFKFKGDGTYLHQHSFDAKDQKMQNLDSLITEVFGHKSVSYRGGRYSFDKDMVKILPKYGYKIDSSSTPGISWENDGGTNYKKAKHKEHFIKTKSETDIFEVPISMKIKTGAPRLSKFAYLNLPNWTHAEGILRRLTGFDIIWLGPSFNTFDKMEWLSDLLLNEGSSYLCIIFHSSVIIPGGTPYAVTGEQVRGFYDRLEKLLDYLLRVRGLQASTLSEFYESCLL